MSRLAGKAPRRQLSVDAIRGSDHGEYFAFARRTVRALARRVGSSDPDDLALMLELKNELDAGLRRAVDDLRAAGFSWAEIANPLGMTRQAAQQRWGIDDSPTLDDLLRGDMPARADWAWPDYDDVPTPERRAALALVEQATVDVTPVKP